MRQLPPAQDYESYPLVSSGLRPGHMAAILLVCGVLLVGIGFAFVSPMVALGVIIGGCVALCSVTLLIVGIIGRR